jgi:ABC-type transport system involved in multi-copper enzyme maturation permease subunit
MLAAREVSLVARREVRRNLRSRKGLAMFSLFLLGGAVPILVQMFVLRLQLNINGIESGSGGLDAELRRAALEKLYDAEIAEYLVACPAELLFLLRGTLFFLPLLVLIVGYDQLAGELQHGSLRYLLGRARRGALVWGKALGIWAVIAAMVLVLHTAVWAATLWRGEAPAVLALSWGGRFWLFSVAQGASYVGLSALVSSLCRTPSVALVVGAGVSFAMGLANTLCGLSESTRVLTWVFPGTYEGLLVSPAPLRALGGMMLLVAWGAACVVVAAEIAHRRDL